MQGIRTIKSDLITEKIAQMCIESNIILPIDVAEKIEKSILSESFTPARNILVQIKDNFNLAKIKNMPICQDTGMAIVFVEIGQNVHIMGDTLDNAINKGIAKGYTEGYLRKSIVQDPIKRINTGDNTPAIIHTSLVKGDNITLSFMPKGFGSENMSALAMLNPADGIKGVRNFVISSVIKAGANPCPPIIVGVGIGGDFEKCALLAKQALLGDINTPNPDEFYANEEEYLLAEINKTGIGPQGLGGKTTALAVKILSYPTHIAGLPVAVNIGCHVTRHITTII